MFPMKIIECDFRYAPEILDIFNDAILNTTALYDYTPWTMEAMKTWFATKQEHGFPIIGIVDEETGKLMGFGSFGMFRVRPAYKYTIENSLYVHRDYRGRGLGKILLSEIIKKATEQQFHCIVGVIDAANDVSIHLHTSFGFRHAGTIKQVGFKFNRWLDVDFYELLLPTPEQPVDGI